MQITLDVNTIKNQINGNNQSINDQKALINNTEKEYSFNADFLAKIKDSDLSPDCQFKISYKFITETQQVIGLKLKIEYFGKIDKYNAIKSFDVELRAECYTQFRNDIESLKNKPEGDPTGILFAKDDNNYFGNGKNSNLKHTRNTLFENATKQVCKDFPEYLKKAQKQLKNDNAKSNQDIARLESENQKLPGEIEKLVTILSDNNAVLKYETNEFRMKAGWKFIFDANGEVTKLDISVTPKTNSKFISKNTLAINLEGEDLKSFIDSNRGNRITIIDKIANQVVKDDTAEIDKLFVKSAIGKLIDEFPQAKQAAEKTVLVPCKLGDIKVNNNNTVEIREVK
jgi:hypothetical protein